MLKRYEQELEEQTITISLSNNNKMEKEVIIYDSYNGCVKSDQTAINTLTTNCGAYGMREGVKIIIYDRTRTSGTNRRNSRTSRQSVRSGRTLSYIDNNGWGQLTA